MNWPVFDEIFGNNSLVVCWSPWCKDSQLLQTNDQLFFLFTLVISTSCKNQACSFCIPSVCKTSYTHVQCLKENHFSCKIKTLNSSCVSYFLYEFSFILRLEFPITCVYTMYNSYKQTTTQLMSMIIKKISCTFFYN